MGFSLQDGPCDKDKKKRTQALEKLEELVLKNTYKLFVPSFAGGAIVNSKREFYGLKIIAPPKTPLERVLNRPEIRGPLEQAMLDTLLDALESSTDNSESDNEDDYLEIKNKLTQPNLPVFALDCSSMVKFFKEFLRDLYKLEEKKKFRLYAKHEDGVIVEEPTPLDIWDETCEDIFPRNQYLGQGRKYIPGNLLWRQKCLVAYIFTKLSVDYNTFCKMTPGNYKNKDWTAENFKALSARNETDVMSEMVESGDKQKTSKIKPKKSQLKSVVRRMSSEHLIMNEEDRFRERNNDNSLRRHYQYDSFEENAGEKSKKSKKKRDPSTSDSERELPPNPKKKSRKDYLSTSIQEYENQIDLKKREFYNRSGTPGTPLDSNNETSDNEEPKHSAKVLKKALKRGNVKKLHEGHLNLTLQIIDIVMLWDKNIPKYQISASDSKYFSKNMKFSPALNQRVVEELKCDIQRPIIYVTDAYIDKDVTVVIKNFSIMYSPRDTVGTPKLLSKRYLDGLRVEEGWPARR